MAPAAADVIYNNFVDLSINPNEYDKIITGDLGKVGTKILLDIMRKKGYDIEEQHMDCGNEIYSGDETGLLL